MVVIIKDSDDLKQKIKEAGDSIMIIDFFAEWCGPCKQIAPSYEQLSQEFPDIVFLKVDVEECEDIAQDYDISSMPTFVFLKNGKVEHKFSGASIQKVRDGIAKLKGESN